jgi:hypothetical protein
MLPTSPSGALRIRCSTHRRARPNQTRVWLWSWGLLSAILGEKRGQVRFVSATLLWSNLGTASRQRHSVLEKLESAALRRNVGRAVRFTSPRGRGRSPGAFFSRPAVTYFSGHFLSMHCRMNGSLTAWSVESSVRATRPNPQKTQIRR